MSVLLIGLGRELALAVIERLTSQRDEVRVVDEDPAALRDYKAAGAHTALGATDDDDLIERAAQNVRTLVLGESATEDTVRAALAGAARARTGRIVLCRRRSDPSPSEQLAGAMLDYVVLRIPGAPRALFKKHAALPVASLAEAIDASDDLAGAPRLDLDLGDAAGWAALKMERPDR